MATPESMILPLATGGFPAPTGAFPVPSIVSDPSFGVNPFRTGNDYLLFDPTISVIGLQERRRQQEQLAHLAQLAATRQATGVDIGDPHEWTQADAALQTDRALAKLATVNPELAEQLQAQRAPGDDDGHGFFDALKQTVGAVLHPALSVGGQILDIVSRTSNIIPNIAYDVVDGGEFNLGDDIGGALTGEVRHNWNSVIQEAFGIQSNIFTATLGLVGDIITDPLTWVIPTGAGVKAAQAAEMAATKLATTESGLLGRAMQVYGSRTAADAGQLLSTRLDELTRGIDANAALRAGLYSDDLAERAAAFINSKTSAGERELLAEMFEVYDRTYRAFATRNIGRMFRKDMPLVLRNRSVPISEVKSIFDEAIRAGAGKAASSPEWRQARAFASVVGGIRGKVVVPFTTWRYISPAIPKLGEGVTLENFARFFAGQSGMTRLMGLIVDGKADWSDMQLWMEKGWHAFNEQRPEIAMQLRGRGMNFGSMYYAASERIGGITEHLSRESRLARTGVGGYLAYQEAKRVEDAVNQFVRETATAVETGQGRAARNEFIQAFESIGYSLKARKVTVTPKDMLKHSKYLDYFPAGVNTASPKAIENWWWALPENAELLLKKTSGAQLSEDELARVARAESILADMQAVAADMTPAERAAMARYQAVESHARNEAAKYEAAVGNVKLNLDEAMGLHPTQVAEFHYATQAPELRQTFYIHETRARQRGRLDSHGVTDQHKLTGADGEGIVVSTKQLSPDDVPVVIRTKGLIELDEAGDAKLGDMDVTVSTQRQAVTEAAEAYSTLAGKNVFEDRAATEAKMLTEELRARRPDANGVLRRETDGSLTVTMWDPADVKRTGDQFLIVGEGRGYLHRTLSREAEEWLNGIKPKDAKVIVMEAPHVAAYMRRKTIGMTLDEAEAAFRREVEKLFPGADMSTLPARVFEVNPLMAHGKYINDLSVAIASEMFGKASRRFVQLGEIAPFMFGDSPRGQLFEWAMSPAMKRLFDKADEKTQQAVARLMRKHEKLQSSTHRQTARVAQEFGIMLQTAEAMEDVGVEDVLADRLTQATLRYGASLSAIERHLDTQEQVINRRLRELDAEDADYDEAFAQTEGKLFEPEQVSRIEAEVAEVDAYIQSRAAHSVDERTGEDALGFTPAPAADDTWTEETSALRQRLGNGQAQKWDPSEKQWVDALTVEPDSIYKYENRPKGVVVSENPALTSTAYVVTNADGRVVGYRSVGNKLGDVITAVASDQQKKGYGTRLIMAHWRDEGVGASPGKYAPADPDYFYHATTRENAERIKREGFWPMLGDDDAKLGVTEAGTYFAESPEVAVSRANAEARASGDLVVLRIPRERVGTTKKIGQDEFFATQRISSGAEDAPLEDTVSAIKRVIGNNTLSPSAVKLNKQAARIVLIGPGGSKYTRWSEDLFDAMADAGLLYRGRDGSVLTKSGDPIRRGGGRRLRSTTERDLERAELYDELETIGQTRASLPGKVAAETPAYVETLGRPRGPQELADLLSREGGFTVHPSTGAKRQTGKAIAVEGAEGVFDQDANLAANIEQWLAAHADELSQEGMHIGGWLDRESGKVYLDVSEVVSTHRQARKLLKERNQLAYYDLGSGKEYRAGQKVPRLERLTDEAARDAAVVRARKTADAKLAYEAGQRLGRLRSQVEFAMAEANRALAEAKGLRARLKPALVKVEQGNMTGLTQLRVPGLQGYAMPAYIADEWHFLLDRHGPGRLRDDWRRFVVGPWKRWATYRWPGFHVRNFFGAWFNNWLGGVGLPDYEFSWRVNRAREGIEKWAETAVDLKDFDRMNLGRIFGKDARGKLTYRHVANFVGEHGIGRANTTAVLGVTDNMDAVNEVYDEMAKGAGKKARRALKRADLGMRAVGTSVEDYMRTAAWAHGLTITEGDVYGARAFTMMRHGDYSDLTDQEDIIRDLVPFYKWMRTNTPYQIRMLAENPAMLTLVDKAKNYAYDVQGLDRAEAELQQPKWLRQSFAVPIPSWVPFIGSKGPDALKFAVLDLPYSDLYNGLQDYLSSVLPVGRNLLESYGFKQTLFSGRPLSGRMQPLAGAFNLPGVRDMLSAFGLAAKGEDGQLYIEDRLQNVLMAFPIYSRFRNFVEGDPERTEQRLGSFLSMVAGVGVREGDATAAELDFYYNEIEPILQAYRDMGVVFPSVDDFQSGEVAESLGLNLELPDLNSLSDGVLSAPEAA